VRTDFTAGDLPGRAMYKMLTAVVLPRPIAWVSTTSAQGVDNLAPHSFFTVASANPPIVQFTSVGRKDSVANAEATGEFVVNFAPEALQPEINATATDFPESISEFDAVGLRREPAAAVKPPRVADSPVALECRLHSTRPMGDSVLVFGEVVHVAVDESVLVDGLPDVRKLRPIARLGRNEWSTLGEVSEVNRIPYAEWRRSRK
jgi:flavin reductase (DIM6/NTAB) family NADH-FMN oxidoreductase RutF